MAELIEHVLGLIDNGEIKKSGKIHAMLGGGLLRNEELYDMIVDAFQGRINIMNLPREDIGPR